MAATVYYVASVLFPAMETYMSQAILSDDLPESVSSRPSDSEDEQKSIEEEIKEAGHERESRA